MRDLAKLKYIKFNGERALTEVESYSTYVLFIPILTKHIFRY